MWDALRRLHLGVKWTRQEVVRGFILDFYAPTLRLVVKIDGAVHQPSADEELCRDKALAELGLFVVHLSKADVLDDIEGVLQRLRAITRPMLP